MDTETEGNERMDSQFALSKMASLDVVRSPRLDSKEFGCLV